MVRPAELNAVYDLPPTTVSGKFQNAFTCCILRVLETYLAKQGEASMMIIMMKLNKCPEYVFVVESQFFGQIQGGKWMTGVGS